MADVIGSEPTRATSPDAGGPAPRPVVPPWEPPMAGDEVAHLLGSLDRMRATFRWKADGLDSDGLRTRVGASSLTFGSLLKHLALVEDLDSTVNLDGSSPGLPWTEVDWEAVDGRVGEDPPDDWRPGRAPEA